MPTPKARLVPLYLVSEDDPEFVFHTQRLRELLVDQAELTARSHWGRPCPTPTPWSSRRWWGRPTGRVADFRRLSLPVLVLTSDFGTMAMWDWEIISYLRAEGVEVMSPYSLDGAKTACRALATKRQLAGGQFLVYQDHPGEGGEQPSIFKRFYWWEDECSQRIEQKFGLRIAKRSFAELGARAKAIPDAVAAAEWERVRDQVPTADLSDRATLSAIKLYRAVRDDLDAEDNVLAAGINCLNESAYSDTTPCLAWDLLFSERDLIWGCEADTVSMLTEFLVNRSLRASVMMTNLYPFLMGQAALQHEKISNFPEVEGNPDDYVLGVHCGYLGVLPRQWSVSWKVRPKALAIVDDNAIALDARLPLGDLSLLKLAPTFEALTVVEGELTGYAGFPGSDCRNGAIIRVPDGHALMAQLPSHHSILSAGHDLPGLELMGRVFGLEVETIGT